MPISNHTEILEGIILARLPEIVRHYDRNSERSSRAVGNAVKAIIDIPAAEKALGSKTTRLAIQALSYTAHRMMDTSVMNASGARYLLQRSLENVRTPQVVEEFKTRFSKSGERTRAPTIEGLKITLDTRKADRPGLDIQDLAQVKELMTMSRRLGPKAGTAVIKKPKDTTPAPALTVMEDAEAVKQEKAGMPEFKKDITPLLDMQPFAEVNPAPAAEEVKLEPGVKGREVYLRALRERCIPSVPVEAPAQSPEVDLEKSMAGVDLVGAMADQATKDIIECLAPTPLRVAYARTLVATIQKLRIEAEVNQRELDRISPHIGVGQVWEDSDGRRTLIIPGTEGTEDKYAMSLQKPTSDSVFDCVFIGSEAWKYGRGFVGYIHDLMPT